MMIIKRSYRVYKMFSKRKIKIKILMRNYEITSKTKSTKDYKTWKYIKWCWTKWVCGLKESIPNVSHSLYRWHSKAKERGFNQIRVIRDWGINTILNWRLWHLRPRSIDSYLPFTEWKKCIMCIYRLSNKWHWLMLKLSELSSHTFLPYLLYYKIEKKKKWKKEVFLF